MTGASREISFDPLRFRAAIFDLDGTLVHSEHVWERAKIDVAARYGKRPTRELLDAHLGRGLKDFLDELFGGPVSPELRRTIGDQIGAEADLWLDRLREPVPGARDWLCRLAEAGLRIAICSSSPRRHIDSAVEMLGLEGVVELAVSGAELPIGKPDPLPFVTTLRALGVESAEAFAVEDSLSGARAARGAGILTLAVGPGCTGPAFEFCQVRAETFADLELQAVPLRRGAPSPVR